MDFRPNVQIRVQQERMNKLPGEIGSDSEWIDLGNDSADDPPKYKSAYLSRAHGSQLRESISMGLDAASIVLTLRIRTDKRVNTMHRVLISGEKGPYDIIHVDNIKNQNQLMDLTCRKAVLG